MSDGSRLLDHVRTVIRIKHYSIRTEQAYVQWIRRYILFHGKRHPRELGAPQLSAFLSHLAVRGRVAASTQNQALNAILFPPSQPRPGGRLRPRVSAVRPRSQSIRTRTASGVGSMCFRRRVEPSILAQVSSAGITPVPTCCSGQSKALCAGRTSPSPPAFIRSVTRSQHICSSRATTFGPCKSCWVTAT